ncbi:MAG: alpha/beta hydrolase [Clostridia bacterium]|nr:alpha/beta hydrolase [Clostridia bacterium]
MLHGYLSNKEAWTAQIGYFSRFYKVTAIDFIGFGNSAPLPSAYSVADYAEWLKETLSALNIVRPHVFAHSFGCRVAVKAASKDCGLFDKLLLTGPAGIILPRGWKYKTRVRAYRFIKKLAPRYAEKHFGSKEYRSLPPLMKESYKKIVNEDLRMDAMRVKNAVLIVEGTKDITTTMTEAEIYLSHFPNAQLKTVEGGHFAFAENPLPFNLIAEEFLYD